MIKDNKETNSIELYFGKGDIGAVTAYNLRNHEDYIFFRQFNTSGNISNDATDKLYDENQKNDKSIVSMYFYKTESIDVLIEMLEGLKRTIVAKKIYGFMYNVSYSPRNREEVNECCEFLLKNGFEDINGVNREELYNGCYIISADKYKFFTACAKELHRIEYDYGFEDILCDNIDDFKNLSIIRAGDFINCYYTIMIGNKTYKKGEIYQGLPLQSNLLPSSYKISSSKEIEAFINKKK